MDRVVPMCLIDIPEGSDESQLKDLFENLEQTLSKYSESGCWAGYRTGRNACKLWKVENVGDTMKTFRKWIKGGIHNIVIFNVPELTSFYNS